MVTARNRGSTYREKYIKNKIRCRINNIADVRRSRSRGSAHEGVMNRA